MIIFDAEDLARAIIASPTADVRLAVAKALVASAEQMHLNISLAIAAPDTSRQNGLQAQLDALGVTLADLKQKVVLLGNG
jgi:hypothetical protein